MLIAEVYHQEKGNLHLVQRKVGVFKLIFLQPIKCSCSRTVIVASHLLEIHTCLTWKANGFLLHHVISCVCNLASACSVLRCDDGEGWHSSQQLPGMDLGRAWLTPAWLCGVGWTWQSFLSRSWIQKWEQTMIGLEGSAGECLWNH